MGKIEGGEERFIKIDSPILREMYWMEVYKFYYRIKICTINMLL